MVFIEGLINFFSMVLNPIENMLLVCIYLFIVIFYHLLLYIIRDMSYLKNLKIYYDSDEVTLNDLKELPVVSFVIPAWKVGELLKDCLESIVNLEYPNLQVIVNAGGDEKTVKIAKSYESNSSFTVIRQEEGGGKINAINEGLKYIDKGLVYLIDADSYITKNIFYKIISLLINQNENIVISITRPLMQQEKSSLVKHITITRNQRFRRKFTRYSRTISPNTCLRYEIIQAIGNLDGGKLIGDGWVGKSMISEGYKIYELEGYKWRIYTFYPNKLNDYIKQTVRWIQNPIFNKIKGKNTRRFVKFTFSTLLSIYILIFPIFLLFNLNLFIFGILFLFAIYLKNFRRIIFFLKYTEKKTRFKLHISFYLELIFYLYIDALINIYTFIEIVIFKDKKYKRRKNII